MSERPLPELMIGERVIGPGHPIFVIAEIGYNFNGIDEARATIDAAVQSGADAVKFQTFRAETIVSRSVDFPQEAGGNNQFEEFKRYELSEDHHRLLFDHAHARNVLAFSTPSHPDDVALLERCEVPAYKMGSDDLTNLPLLSHVATLEKPIIFSTGMGTLCEVFEAYNTIRAAGNNQLAILHCVSNYPVQEPRLLNLRVIEHFREVFDVPIGFSDHTTSNVAALGAVALGASIIERHFTLDKGLDVPDAFFSADPQEFAQLVSSIRELEQALGEPIKAPVETEQAMRQETRKSLMMRIAVRRGEPLSHDNLIAKRPGYGISPKHLSLVVGRSATRDIEADEILTWDLIG